MEIHCSIEITTTAGESSSFLVTFQLCISMDKFEEIRVRRGSKRNDLEEEKERGRKQEHCDMVAVISTVSRSFLWII